MTCIKEEIIDPKRFVVQEHDGEEREKMPKRYRAKTKDVHDWNRRVLILASAALAACARYGNENRQR
jgi:hypothetical protein